MAKPAKGLSFIIFHAKPPLPLLRFLPIFPDINRFRSFLSFHVWFPRPWPRPRTLPIDYKKTNHPQTPVALLAHPRSTC